MMIREFDEIEVDIEVEPGLRFGVVEKINLGRAGEKATARK